MTKRKSDMPQGALPLKKRKYVPRPAPRGELKWFDTSVTNSTLSTVGTIVSSSLNLLSAGTGESQLIGKTATVKSIFIRAQVQKPALSNATLSNVASDDYVRIMVVLDKQCNGAAATIAQILEDTDMRSLNNLNYSKRFVTLKEMIVPMKDTVNHDGTNYFTGSMVVPIDPCYLKREIPIEFGAAPSGAITDVRSNNILILGFSNTGQTTLSFRSRIRFVDY